jgi:Fe-S-cluster containining protein
MSVCDSCFVPGNCCRAVILSGDPRVATVETALEAIVQMAAQSGFEEHPLSFMPLYRRRDGNWVWWCFNLLPNGRCGDYANRPHACRTYEAGTDDLCVHYGGAEGASDDPVSTNYFTRNLSHSFLSDPKTELTCPAD